jgi:DNA replication licensing factor MCM2
MTDSSPLTTPAHSEAESSDSDHEAPRADARDDEPSGEDLDATANRDYRAIPTLDTYENEGLDGQEYPEMGLAARLDADAEIRRRRNAARGVMDLEWGSDDGATFLRRQREQLRRHQRGQDALDLDQLLRPDADNPVELQQQPGVLSQYLDRPEIRREISRRFQDFLVRFELDTKEKIYVTRIRTMGSRNLSSFDVDYRHLAEGSQLIAVWLGDAPAQVLPILDDAAFQLVITGFFPEYARIAPEVHVRIAGLPICDNIRDLRQTHLNVLVRTVGVVTKATTVLPQLRIVKWRCGRCGASVGPFPVTDDRPVPPTFCPQCNARTGFRVDSADAVYRNYQRIDADKPALLAYPRYSRDGLHKVVERLLLARDVPLLHRSVLGKREEKAVGDRRRKKAKGARMVANGVREVVTEDFPIRTDPRLVADGVPDRAPAPVRQSEVVP